MNWDINIIIDNTLKTESVDYSKKSSVKAYNKAVVRVNEQVKKIDFENSKELSVFRNLMNNDNFVVRAQAAMILIRLVKMDKDELVSCISTLTEAISLMSGDIRITYELWFDFWKQGKYLVVANEFPR